MNINLQYSGSILDRGDALRREPEDIELLWHSEQCYVLPMISGRNLFRTDKPVAGQVEAVFAPKAALSSYLTSSDYRIYLGEHESRHYFTLEVGAHEEGRLTGQYGGEFIDLRSVGATVEKSSAAMLAYARALIYWQQQHQFCSKCGHANQASNGGHVLKCTSESCQRETYPRTDPAVIMLIERVRPDGVRECLLGRHPRWDSGSFSTLAGFVEPGESLEEAVRREVAEESGVKVGKVAYLASQPWPFPASIMLGFIGEAIESEITLDPHELAEAYWFSVEELKNFGEWGDGTSQRNLPRHDSISRFLIDHWLDAHT